MDETPEKRMIREVQNCVQNSTDCHTICLDTVMYCLDRGGEFAAASRVRVLLDRAEICQMTANFLLRGSDLKGRVGAACAEVCDYCALQCEPFMGDVQIQSCGDACRRCSAACREVATLTA
ncbi:MAG: four-helix bundle copper-binding protein [Ardenticatenaceae bacterium]|nr:four-helix bundle copper-binding protein [Ardenticatenaceae bacterium]